MSKKKKKDELNFKWFLSSSRGRAILFLGAYLIFFIIIAFLARSGGSSNDRVYETGSPYQFSLANIESNNYAFTYEIVIDGTTHLYHGTRTANNELFTLNNSVEYYSNAGIYFTNSNGVWLNTDNPYILKGFIDVENISSLIEGATYLSRTEYDSGKDVYNFLLSSATISRLMNNQDLDIEEVPNELVVSTDDYNYVNEVKFILNSYCKNMGLCVNNMTVDLKYEYYGEIEEITSPLE